MATPATMAANEVNSRTPVSRARGFEPVMDGDGRPLPQGQSQHDGDRSQNVADRATGAYVPPSTDVVRAGQDLFGWLHRHHLAITGPAMEEHLVDADDAHAVVLEVSVHPQWHPPRPDRFSHASRPPNRGRTAGRLTPRS